MNDFIMQMRPLFEAEEKKAVCDYMDEDGFITEFKRTQEFETMLSDYTGAKHAIVVNNGTISLTLMAMAAGVQAGDEVIVPNYTMIATPNSLRLFGATPVFVDVEADTLWMDIEKVEAAITNKTKAIMIVSANGRPPSCGISAFEKLASDHGILLMEDSAQALGSYYPDGRHIGRAGIAGSFSFSAPKIISTGQGGAVITDDDSLANNLRRLKDFGRSGGGNDIHDTIGFNFKFTELQACIGVEQMKKLDHRVARKKAIYKLYKEGLEGTSEIKLFDNDCAYTAPWFYDCLAKDRDNLILFLKENNIGSRVMYPPITKQKAYAIAGDFPVAEMVGQLGLWLPSAVQLTDTEVKHICAKIREFYS